MVFSLPGLLEAGSGVHPAGLPAVPVRHGGGGRRQRADVPACCGCRASSIHRLRRITGAWAVVSGSVRNVTLALCLCDSDDVLGAIERVW